MADKLFYDGGCPMCRAEIKRLAQRPGAPELCDISSLNDDALPLPRRTLMSELHLLTDQGDWVRGLDANLRVWRRAGARVLPRLLGSGLVHPIALEAYRYWARWRLRRRMGDSPCE
ncbi:MAG TPA: DCC1-like thiol-disulfide oxidoreductase family protein [Motiliproteus sp.]